MSTIITRETLRLFRGADDVIFRSQCGQHTIELRHRDGGQETTTIVPTSGSANTSRDGWTGFEMTHAAKFGTSWPSACVLLKVGDVVALLWNADGHGSPLTEEAGLKVDRLDLLVTRIVGTKMIQFYLHQSTRVTLDNSARMIKGV